MSRACTVERRMVVRHGVYSRGTYKHTHTEAVTRACGAPLSVGDGARAGMCQACADGWEVADNAFTHKGRAQLQAAVDVPS